MTDSSSFEALLRVRAALAEGRPIAANDAQWFVNGVDCYLSKEVSAPLDQYLGLASTGKGKRRARTKYRLERRNELIRNAANVSCANNVIEQSYFLESELRKFRIVWSIHKNAKKLPDHYSDLNHILFDMFLLSVKVDLGYKQILRILRHETHF